MMINTGTWREFSDEEVQEMIRKTIARHGCFILSSNDPEYIGAVQTWAGLPFRIVRFVTREEAAANYDQDIWITPWVDEDKFYFEVVVAD